MTMHWSNKALALMMLVGWHSFAIKIREDGTWYVSLSGLERKEGGMGLKNTSIPVTPWEWATESENYLLLERKEGGTLSTHTSVSLTPEKAVEAAWEWATDPEHYLVLDSLRDTRRAVKWNGFMWTAVQERGR
jgi:hypothetical protein